MSIGDGRGGAVRDVPQRTFLSATQQTSNFSSSLDSSLSPKLDLPVPIRARETEKGSPQLEEEKKATRKWNTSNLGLRFGADACSAASASILVAPIICVIDKSIVIKASSQTGSASLPKILWSSARPALAHPITFLGSRPFLLVFALYFSTYLTANSVDTVTSTLHSQPATTISSGLSKFAATSAVNMTACVYKDSQFARLFGSKSPAGTVAKSIPTLSYALFATRDSLTILSSFNLPPIIAKRLVPSETSSLPKGLSSFLSRESNRLNTAQFLTPAAMQLVSTPIHLLGLDLYNRQESAIGPRERLARVVRDWGVSALARMGRIIPAFGVGGVVNAALRRSLMGKVEGQNGQGDGERDRHLLGD